MPRASLLSRRDTVPNKQPLASIKPGPAPSVSTANKASRCPFCSQSRVLHSEGSALGRAPAQLPKPPGENRGARLAAPPPLAPQQVSPSCLEANRGPRSEVVSSMHNTPCNARLINRSSQAPQTAPFSRPRLANHHRLVSSTCPSSPRAPLAHDLRRFQLASCPWPVSRRVAERGSSAWSS